MAEQIIPVKLKITNCYLIRGSINGETTYVMVDAGPPGTAGIFTSAIEKLSVDPGEIKLIFITHGHWDHWGSLKEIMEITGARAAINHRESPWLEEKRVRVPGGQGIWGKFLFAFAPLLKPLIKKGLQPVRADMALEDDGHSLESYGITGRILHTPGHTGGSMSLLLDSGDAFVGDLAMSGFPRISGPGPFVLGNDITAMKRSWQLLLDAGAVKIYPSHGKPFSARVFDEYYKSGE
jgi:glyoxylase-like metal-dependent hydrolase (beta-lactamase superfamily II)